MAVGMTLQGAPRTVAAIAFVSFALAACGGKAPAAASSPSPAASTHWRIAESNQLAQIQAASCANERLCIVIDRAGYIVSRDGGVTWVRGTIGSAATQFTGSAISCPSVKLCVVAGMGGASVQPAVAVSGDGGGSWQVQQFDGRGSALNTVICPSESLCLTAGSAYDSQLRSLIYVSKDGGSHWHGVAAGIELDLSDIACASALSCSAVGSIIANGAVGPPAMLTTADGGENWATKLINGAASLEALACASNGRCIATGLSTDNIVTTQPVIYVQEDASHSSVKTVTFLGATRLDRISCSTPSFCVAVGYGYTGSGQNVGRVAVALVTNNGGKSWEPESVPGNVMELITISCAPVSGCISAGITDPYGYLVLIRS